MSQPNLDIVGACYAVRKEAETLAGQNYAFNLQKKTGALDAITSPENGGVDASLITYDNGAKIAKLNIFYDQRTKTCQTTHDCFQSVCDPGTTPLRRSATITIDDCVKTPVRVYTNDDMVALCSDPAQFMRRRLESDLRAAREYLSARILAEIDAAKGPNLRFNSATQVSGTVALDLIGADASSQPIPLPGNFAAMPLDYENNQLNGIPFVVGQGNFELFWKLNRWSCCNSVTPYGAADFEGEVRFYKDQQSNAVIGQNEVLMFAPGVLHLLTFNENRQIEQMGTNTAGMQSIVIPDPAGYPFSWNFDLYYDICDKAWKSMASLTWGMFNTFQADSFASNAETAGSPDCSDELDNVSGVFSYLIN